MGKYQLIRKLATGGMAEVFLAKAAGARGFEKTLVVKRILPHLAEEPQFIDMFLAEAKLAALLNHAHVAQIFDFGEADGSYFIAMEYVDGPNLRMLSRRASELKTPIPLPLCARIVSYACEGLAYAHDLVDPESGEPLGLIHRDVSSDNIMLSRNGGVKVVDFGIAKAANQFNRTRTGVVKGKLAYMSPEQLKSEPLDPRTDVYALGVVLYELVVGRKPFEADSEVGLMRAVLDEPLRAAGMRREEVPAELDRIIDKALAKSRDLRYASCRAFQADLDHFLIQHGTPVGSFQLSEWVKALTLPAPKQGVQEPAQSPSMAAPKTELVAPAPSALKTKAETPRGVHESLVPASPPPKADQTHPPRVGSRIWIALGLLLSVAVCGYVGWKLNTPEVTAPLVRAASPAVDRRQEPELTPPAPASRTPPLASFVVESVPPGHITVEGKAMGDSPARVTGVNPGEIRIETSGPGFFREEHFSVRPGDNGTLRLIVEKGILEIRVLPSDAQVTLDGQLLGTSLGKQTVFEGPHSIQALNPKTQKWVLMECPRMKPNGNVVCKLNLGSE